MTSNDKARIDGRKGRSGTESEGKGLRIPNAIEDAPGGGRDNTTYRGKGKENATVEPDVSGLEHHGGGRGSEVIQGGGAVIWDDDSTVAVTVILERFENNTKARLKRHTQIEYGAAFRRFAKATSIENYSRRQLAGPKGKHIILDFLTQHIPKPSWRTQIAMLRTVWTMGLNLPWPVDSKTDVGKLPRVRREESPPDDAVKAWAAALEHESDTYLRLLWLLIGQFGWRPSHVAHLHWRNVRFQNDKPYAIVADGVEEDFKTASPIAARLPADVVSTLIAWRKETEYTNPDNILIPWRSCTKRIENRPLDNESIKYNWDRIRKRWKLPSLRPKHLRHWAATAARKAGLSKQASAAMMGHDSASGEAMRDWYDNPGHNDIFDEQSTVLPDGLLGTLKPPEIKIIEAFPSDALSILREYMDGRIGTMEMATRMEAVRLRQPSTTSLLQP
jgi:integrase